MSPRSPAWTAAAAGALVVLCGVASYVGASLARGPETSAPAGGGTPSSVVPRLDELERDRDAMKERLRRTEELARATLDQVTDLRGRIEAAGTPSPGSAAPAAPEPPKRGPPNGIDPEGTMTPEERAVAFAQRVEEDARRFAPMQMRFQFGLWSDDTPEGAEARRRQAVMESGTFVSHVGFTGEKEREVRDAFVTFYERCASELGPAVRDFEKADLAAVEATLPKLWAAFDAELKDLVGEEKFKAWASLVARPRELALQIYAEERKKR